MKKYVFSDLSLSDLRNMVELTRKGVSEYEWTCVEKIHLLEEETSELRRIIKRLQYVSTLHMNEATLWARAIYPLLLLAEKDDIVASSEVALDAQYAKFELHGVADGVLGKYTDGDTEAPYLVITEAKRGMENKDPWFQLYGQLLAAEQQR